MRPIWFKPPSRKRKGKKLFYFLLAALFGCIAGGLLAYLKPKKLCYIRIDGRIKQGEVLNFLSASYKSGVDKVILPLSGEPSKNFNVFVKVGRKRDIPKIARTLDRLKIPHKFDRGRAVILKSFSSMSDANSLSKRLMVLGLPALVEEVEVGKFAVENPLIGPIPKNECKSVADVLKKNLKEFEISVE